MTASRGPEGSPTPIIVVTKAHRWQSYELIHSVPIQPCQFHPDLFSSKAPLRHLAFPANHIDMPSLPPCFDPTETPATRSLAPI